VPVFQLVGHHDRIVDDQAQGDGDPCQRSDVYLHPGQIIENRRDGQRGDHRKKDHRQVAKTPAYHQHEKQQDSHRESAAEIDLVQLGADILGRIV